MKKVKITVLKTTLDRELAAEYGAEGLGPCPMLKEGQVFFADYARPDGLCDEAWKERGRVRWRRTWPRVWNAPGASCCAPASRGAVRWGAISALCCWIAVGL